MNKNKKKIGIYPATMGTQSFGGLQVRCTQPGLEPVEGSTVSITAPGNPNDVIEQLTTDSSGLTERVELPAPPLEYSQEPNSQQPYSNYDVMVEAIGFENVTFSNVEILPDVYAEQDAILTPAPVPGAEEVYVIAPHTLYAEYPPKIPEDEVKPVVPTGEIVLDSVVVPEFVIVHDGPPNSSAQNYWIRFRDYIKNVASSEIYATWPEATIYANILAILSFTLNRVYTEWYRSQGYNFTITSSTAYDQKWINGRNIYQNIGLAVDSVFVNYLSRPNILQPILSQYCDGNRVQCPNWLSQWGSKYLGDQGNAAIEILRFYYGNDIYIDTAQEVSGVPVSWPGTNLTVGSTGNSVRTIQQQLNRIAQSYPAIPTIAVDGIFGPRTEEAVQTFQQIFNLPANGIVDMPTWYKISYVFVGVARLAE